MEDTIVILRFAELGRARRALHDLERFDGDGRLQVRGAALVQRSGQGGIDAPAAARDQEGHYLPPGGTVSLLLDVLGGPVGMLSSRPAEGFEGHGGRSPYDGERETILEEISRSLEPGVTLVVAEIADPDPEVLDSALAALGGSVTRRAAREVYAEVRAAEAAETRADGEARREQRHEQLNRFKEGLKVKLP
jgi:hypothetical protein